MAIILILVVLWAAVLGIPIARWFQRRSGQVSIDSFHHSLDTLQRSGPKLVEPAYRLSGSAVEQYESGESTLSTRPKLVLLRPLNVEEETMYNSQDSWTDEHSGERYERYESEYDDYANDDRYYGAEVPAGSAGRRLAAAKRRKIVLGIAGTFLATLILGFVASTLWDISIVAFLALGAYVAMMARAALAEGQAPEARGEQAQRGERPSMAERLKARMADLAGDDQAFDGYDDEYESGYDEDFADYEVQEPAPRYREERHIAHARANGQAAMQLPAFDEDDEWWDDEPIAVGR